MNINEILQLDMLQGSIKKIDLFLVSQIKYSNDYIKAFTYKAKIFHHIGKTNEALKLLFGLVPQFKEMDSEAIIIVCDGIIDICLEVDRFDQVLKYIKIKQNYLPISKNQIHIKDNIRYYLKSNNMAMAKEELNKYLLDDLTKEEYIFAKEELAKIYYNEHNYNKFIEIAPDLESYYQANLALNSLSELGLRKLIISYERGNYIRVLNDGNQYIKDPSIKLNHKIQCATLLIRCYILSGDYKRASIVESDYEELIDEVDNIYALDFCYAALDLYTKTNTLISINDYNNKIKALELSKKEVKVEKKRKKKIEEIVIPVVNEEIEIDLVTEKKPIILNNNTNDVQSNLISPNINAIKDVIVSENYSKLQDIFNTISQVDISLKFREVYRLCCIKISELFNIDEIYLLYYKRGYLGLHYKKERAYDKKLEFEDIENTLSFHSMTYEIESFLDPENPLYDKNIVTHKEYEQIPYGFSYPLLNNINCYGSIAYFSNNSFLDKEMVYESLKLISSMLNTRLNMAIKQEEIEFSNRKLFFINANMSSGVKEEIDGYLHFSMECANILGVFEDICESEYLLRMRPQEIVEYRRIHEEIYTLLTEDIVFEYDFKNDKDEWIRIKERYYPMVNDGVICILSLIDDITDIEKNKKDLMNLAFTNPISKMNTEVKLISDLKKVISNHKLSLAIIDVKDITLYEELYGYNFCKQLINQIGKELKIALEEEFNSSIYHLEYDRYAILYNNINDKRVIDSKLNTLFKKLNQALIKINNRVNLKFNAGVFRLAKHSNINEEGMIISYALEALTDAKGISSLGNNISHFDSELHKIRFKENNLVTHISEAIDHGRLSLTYKQIVDLEKNQVYGYNVLLNLDNYDVDESYLDYVIKRRGLLEQIEKYVISNLFKEIKMFKDSLRANVLCFVKVSNETLNQQFLSFLNTLQTLYKINTEYIVFIVDDALNPIAKRLRADGFKIATLNILDVYSNNTDYFLYDYHDNGIDTVNEIKQLCCNHLVSLILRNVNTKEDINDCRRRSFDLVYGSYYKKILRMKTIIENNKY